MENNGLHLLLESDHPAEVANPPVISQIFLIRLSLIFAIKRGRAFRHLLLAPIGEFDGMFSGMERVSVYGSGKGGSNEAYAPMLFYRDVAIEAPNAFRRKSSERIVTPAARFVIHWHV